MSLEVKSPYDHELIETIPTQTEPEVMATLQHSHDLHLDRDGWLPKRERLAVLRRAADLVEARQAELAVLAAREGGKPLVDSRVEIRRAVNGLRIAASELEQLAGQEVPMGLDEASAGHLALTHREPRGVVLAISAFNHPFNLIVHQVVPAFAVGCPVIVKPAPATPLSCRNLVRILHEAGAPEAWVRMVMCEDEVTQKMVEDRRLGFLTFIGSAKVGFFLRSRLAPGATCALEHGGAAPVIVDDSADVEVAVAPLVRAGFYHAGQVCVSTQRIYVHRSVRDPFVEAYVGAVEGLTVGDPVSEDTDVGPLIRPQEVERVHAWVKEALEGGASLRCGGEPVGDSCYRPTVLVNPPEHARVSQEEIFGPVVCIYDYDDLDDAVRRANAPDYFFQAAVYTQRLDTALSLSQRLAGMAVMVNEHTAFRVDWMPFGGHRQSGLGLGGIGHAMRDMTLERMVVFKGPWT